MKAGLRYRWPLTALLVCFSIGASAHGQNCPAWTEARAAQLSEYVQKLYKLPASEEVRVENHALLSDSCITRMEFSSRKWPSRVTFYLSGEGNYLFPAVRDLREEPYRQERQEQARVAAQLDHDPDSPSRGRAKAAVTIVEFSDFQCPHCAKLARTLKNEVLPAVPEVRLVFKFSPGPYHAWALRAAKTAYCVAGQNLNAFWALHDFLFDHQTELKAANLDGQVQAFLADQPGVSQAKLQSCLAGAAAQEAVQRDMQLSRQVAIPGTPTLFVNGIMLSGAQTAEAILDAIRQAASAQAK